MQQLLCRTSIRQSSARHTAVHALTQPAQSASVVVAFVMACLDLLISCLALVAYVVKLREFASTQRQKDGL